jgi:NAD(P)-dependent dehydrogenase (short-subunit alcohol dehydrogenase family)
MPTYISSTEENMMNSEAEFSGRVAIVTGGSKGIGRATARMLAKRGASLLLVGRSQEALDAVLADMPLAGNAFVMGLAGDIADASTATRALKATLDRAGRIDILANIAGAFPTALLADTTDAHFADAIASNLTGTFNFCRAVLPTMIDKGHGAIVNISSTAARFPTPGLSVYGAAKAGIEAFTRAIAMEAAPTVRVNAVSVGPTMTEAVEALMVSDTSGAVEAVTRSIPLGRLAAADEIAEAILFLASDRASFITGQVLHANGGGIMA